MADEGSARSQIIVTVEKWLKWLLKWLSSRTLHNVLLVVFTFGVMFATCQYSDTAKKSQRPWVGTQQVGSQVGDTVQASFTLAPETPVDIAVAYRNYGLSPALKCSAAFHSLPGSAPPQSEADWTDKTAPKVPDCHATVDALPGMPLFPNPGNFSVTEHQSFDTRPSFSTPDTDAIKAGKKGLYLVGCISYSDQWGKRHYTDVCLYFAHADGSLQGTFAYCPKGNNAN